MVYIKQFKKQASQLLTRLRNIYPRENRRWPFFQQARISNPEKRWSLFMTATRRVISYTVIFSMFAADMARCGTGPSGGVVLDDSDTEAPRNSRVKPSSNSSSKQQYVAINGDGEEGDEEEDETREQNNSLKNFAAIPPTYGSVPRESEEDASPSSLTSSGEIERAQGGSSGSESGSPQRPSPPDGTRLQSSPDSDGAADLLNPHVSAQGEELPHLRPEELFWTPDEEDSQPSDNEKQRVVALPTKEDETLVLPPTKEDKGKEKTNRPFIEETSGMTTDEELDEEILKDGNEDGQARPRLLYNTQDSKKRGVNREIEESNFGDINGTERMDLESGRKLTLVPLIHLIFPQEDPPNLPALIKTPLQHLSTYDIEEKTSYGQWGLIALAGFPVLLYTGAMIAVYVGGLDYLRDNYGWMEWLKTMEGTTALTNPITYYIVLSILPDGAVNMVRWCKKSIASLAKGGIEWGKVIGSGVASLFPSLIEASYLINFELYAMNKTHSHGFNNQFAIGMLVEGGTTLSL